MDAAARAESDKVSQFSGNVLGWGAGGGDSTAKGQVSDRRHYKPHHGPDHRPDGASRAQVAKPPAPEGWEHAESIDPRELALTATRQALVKLGAAPARAGTCRSSWRAAWRRHLPRGAATWLETTSVAKKASVFHDKMGQLIANPAVSAVDEGLQATPGAPSTSMTRGWRPSTPSSSRTAC